MDPLQGFLPDRTPLELLPCYVFAQRGDRLVYGNRAARELLGAAEGKDLSLPVSEVFAGAYPGLIFSGVAKPGSAAPSATPAPNSTGSFECTLSAAGRLFTVHGSYAVLDPGDPLLLVTLMPLNPGDPAHQHATFLEELLDSSPEAIAITHGLRILHVNAEFQQLFGYSQEQAMGKDLFGLILPDSRRHEGDMLRSAVDQTGKAALETVRLARSGELVDVSVLVRPLVLAGAKVGYFASYRDIREQKRVEAKLQHDALHDPLTGLANRALFLDRLQITIARKQRRPEFNYAVLFLDLDRLKTINDTLGHASGDQVLVAIANRLRLCLRPQDTVARFGGDEFAVLLENVSSSFDVKSIVDRMHREIRQPIEVFGHEVVVSGSTGVAFGTSEHVSAEEVLRDADFAMYRAKTVGGSRHEIFDETMQVHVSTQRERELGLRRALNSQEFEVWYQPAYRLESGELESFEALLRWRQPGGMVPPGDILPLAEDTGLILPIGRLVLEVACRQAREWLKEGPRPELRVSVNLSPRQFNQADLASKIADLLDWSGLPAGHLRIEVPEEAIGPNPDTAVAVLERLRDMGVSLALDNFGAGVASMNYLVRLPVDLVKIDRKLISQLPGDGKQGALLDMLFHLGRTLKVRMLAQGIETAEQLEALKARGCELGQGYLFSPPVTAVEARELLSRRGSTAPLRK